MRNKNALTLLNTSWNPLTELRREMDRLFDNFSATEGTQVPLCDLEEKGDNYLLTAEMPGVPKDNVRVEVIDNQVVISGEQSSEERKDEGGTVYSERRYGKFQRSFSLPTQVDAEKVQASYDNGILRVMIPKAESAKPRQIQISSGSGQGAVEKQPGDQKEAKKAA